MLSGVPGFLGLHIGPGDGRKCVLLSASLSIPVEAGGGDGEEDDIDQHQDHAR